MRICNLCSGSSGNSTFIESENAKILVDCGKPFPYIFNTLNELSVTAESINAILITHEHSDHIKGIQKFAKTYNTKVYAPIQIKEEVKTEKKAVKTEKSTLKTYNTEKPANKKFDRKKAEKPTTRREESEFDKKLVEVRRVAKVVKGGRTLRFSALVVVGNKNGLVGVGNGKANEVPEAIEKATAAAKKNLISVPIVGTTIPHNVTGKYGSSSVLMLPASEGTGVIAGGSARAVVELAGIKDITTKTHGSNNKINCVKATLEGLKALRTREQIAALRGKAPEEI